ncbi:unnamed protein product [Parnassius apollo]|uniref:(apollo) hypothetical protein n=1 Tax=Parnassius apollo TaxID=110799 RepID=A0A8S3X6T7_PARAO|nr:unnamed protein product [Parnassius apollo]
MDISDAVLGKLILVTTVTIFVILVFWINTYPFIDTDLAIYKYIPDPQWVLLFCATWGFFFIGGLMLFTLYHIYPHL